MSLSNSTLIKLSKALEDEIAYYITIDDRFLELITELIPEAIVDKLGEVDANILHEISMRISENLRVTSS
jgi:hypothetical protein